MEQPELKRKLEALLFSVAKKVSIEELSKLCKEKEETTKKALEELKKEYETNNSSMMLIEEGDGWKIGVRENYLGLVKKVVKTTEITKSVMETLAVIAWKAPVMQAEVIRIRTNKAYNHIVDLEKSGFISKEKKGRSQLIRLSQKFMDYFDLKNENEVKEKFKNVKPGITSVEQKEMTIELK